VFQNDSECPEQALRRKRAARSSGARSCAHLPLQLVHLDLDHQVNRFMGCDDNLETALAHLKTTIPMEVLHGQTVPGVPKELTVLALVDQPLRMAMCQSATLQHPSVDRINVVDTLRWLGAPSTGIP
jgi:hypothetical protein